MALHGLPSLATLRLGAPTGMPGTNADGKRPVKASRVEDAEDAEDASPQAQPEMLLLTHLPRDVIGKIVTQAALDARRTSLNPPSEICAWMKRFCTAARMQGVPCDDYWYKLALVTFAVDPDAVAEPPPDWMRGDTKLKKNAKLSWREFFGSVCDVLLETPSSYAGIKKSFPKLLNFWSVTQRDLDQELQAMFRRCAEWIKHANGSRLPIVDHLKVVKDEWDGLMQGWMPAVLFSFKYWPLIGLLLLRGAEPWTRAKYDALDHEVYVAIMGTRGDDLSAPERLSTNEAIRRIADAVARGASTTRTVKSLQPHRGTLSLTAALEVNNIGIIRWLLDHGADAGSLAKEGNYDPKWASPNRQYEYVRQLITKTVYDVDEWQADLDTTEALIVNAVSFFENAKERDQTLFLEARDILGLALNHMEDNGFQGNDQSSENMDVGPLIPASQVAEDDYSDTDGAHVKELIYNAWNSIFDDEYGAEVYGGA